MIAAEVVRLACGGVGGVSGSHVVGSERGRYLDENCI